ncbi:MAG TPA: DUF434 domain-containing protein [Phycisphaerae bacterium]|nr:DUF434 domain-containing protein [Phycisphaerae bacterium]
MPDKRKHRGAHPEDERFFAADQCDALRRAVEEYSWLLTREYAEDSALALVGNRYSLTERQRLAVRRASCSDQSLRRRTETMVPLSEGTRRPLGIDGYNLLITVESALSGGPIFAGRDGSYRDLASIHGTYRKVNETQPAITMIADHLSSAEILAVDWYLDRPVSNSARLKVLMAEVVEHSRLRWNIELADNPDAVLAAYDGVVATSDSWILDRCAAWVNLARDIIDAHVPDAWKITLR